MSKKTARNIVAHKQADYVLAVKDNQPSLLDDISIFFDNPGSSHFTTTEKSHGRIEVRKIWCASEIKGVINFPYASQVFRIDRQMTNVKSGKTSKETAFYVTSLSQHEAKAESLLSYVRGHWSIENRLHHVRDTTFDEDRCRIRSATGQRVMASIRNTAIGLIRLKTTATNIEIMDDLFLISGAG